MKATLLVHMPEKHYPLGRRVTNELLEYPVDRENIALKQPFSEYADLNLAVAMCECGLHPEPERGTVYGYIINRKRRYCDRFYGWARPRKEWTQDEVAAIERTYEQTIDFYRRHPELEDQQESLSL